MGYICKTCGKYHDDLPLCFGAEAPWRATGVPPDEFKTRVELNDDLCVVDGKHFFIRGNIVLPVQESDKEFVWSVWCSLSEESFRHVNTRWHDPHRAGDGYFGWLCTALPCYETTTIHLKTNVRSRDVGVCPLVELQETDHPLYEEQRHGISWQRVHEIMHALTPSRRRIAVVEGDLLDQDVDVIVNAWNRNIIPWWLLLPQGVSGAIKRRAGYAPFRELGKKGPIPLGGAVETCPGRLPFKAIIHVAGINMFWRSSERSIRDSVRNALKLASERGYRSIGFPLIGSGSGGGKPDEVLEIMRDELSRIEFDGEVRIVRFPQKVRSG
jgi:O-acetyl-ADP-ribose deacetylase